MSRNALGVGVSAFPEKSVMKVCGSTLLALRGGGWGSNFQKKALRKNVPQAGGRRITVVACAIPLTALGRSGSVIFFL